MGQISLIVFGMAYAWIGAAQTLSISGSVVGEGSTALPGIPVYCIRTGPDSASPESGRTPPPAFTARATTDARGSFTLPNLPAGTYNLCALAAFPGQVSSCELGDRPLIIPLAADSSQTGVQLIMGSGDVVTVHVNDVNGKLGKGAHLSIGFIADNGRYGFAKMTGQAGQVIQYELTIPKQRVSRLVVDTALAISDVQGAVIAAGKPGPVLAGPAEVTITVR